MHDKLKLHAILSDLPPRIQNFKFQLPPKFRTLSDAYDTYENLGYSRYCVTSLFTCIITFLFLNFVDGI